MTIKSATSRGEVFIQGQFMSIGINADGGLGTLYNAPTGFASDLPAGHKRVGMFADLDGFGQGATTALHDATLMGRSIEGFNIGYKTGGKTFVQSNQTLTGYSEIDGANTDKSTASSGQAVWNGVTTEKLAVLQKITLAHDAKFVRIDVTLTNNSGSTMTDLRYMRTVDPDHGPTFSTVNKIERQGDDGALLSATANKASFFLFSEDDRAVVSTYGFVNADPYAADAYSSPQAEGYTKTADQTANITFGLGSLAAGASTTITLYMGVTDDLKATISRIESASDDSDDDDDGDDDRDDDDGDDDDGDDDDVVVDVAPVAADDSVVVNENAKASGNVLSNDRDPEGAKLSAALKTGPANGVLSLSADGSFVYTPNAGFSGTDAFSYVASDGKNSDAALVKITVEDVPDPVVVVPDVIGDLLGRAGTVDGSGAANQTLTGVAAANTFFFDADARSGDDVITNFGANDVLVVDRKLYDGNNDGLIALSNGSLSIDAPRTEDSVTIAGVSGLRYLGVDDKGLAVYADASVRPRGAKEGSVADNTLTADRGDKVKNTYLFDTALDIDLGNDVMVNFGRRDLIVTTDKLEDGNDDGQIALTGGVLDLGRGRGTVAMKGVTGAAVNALEFDGAVVNDGVTYYVYSLVGSVVDTGDVLF